MEGIPHRERGEYNRGTYQDTVPHQQGQYRDDIPHQQGGYQQGQQYREDLPNQQGSYPSGQYQTGTGPATVDTTPGQSTGMGKLFSRKPVGSNPPRTDETQVSETENSEKSVSEGANQ